MFEETEEILRFRKLVHAFMFGELTSKYADESGIDFAELVRFEEGDSEANINWPVSINQGEKYITRRAPDKELEVVFLLDTTSSMNFGSLNNTKWKTLSLFLSEALGVITREHHLASFLCFDTDGAPVRRMVRNKEKKKLLKPGESENALQNLCENTSQSVFDIGRAITYLDRGLGRNKTLLLIVLSDFIDCSTAYVQELKRFLRNRHGFAGCIIRDSMEVTFPKLRFGVLKLRDMETNHEMYTRKLSDESRAIHQRIFAEKDCSLQSIDCLGS